MIRIIVADDQPVLRSVLRLRLALEPDLCVVGEAADGVEALRGARDLAPDVVVMDANMPRLDGLAAAEALRFGAPHIRVVILTVADSASLRERAHAVGAIWVAKQAGDAPLLAAIRGGRA